MEGSRGSRGSGGSRRGTGIAVANCKSGGRIGVVVVDDIHHVGCILIAKIGSGIADPDAEQQLFNGFVCNQESDLAEVVQGLVGRKGFNSHIDEASPVGIPVLHDHIDALFDGVAPERR